MKAIARLIFTYYTGTALLRFISAAGLVAGIGGAALLLYFPPLTGGSSNPTRLSLAQEAVVFFLPIAGLLCFTFGASLLPTLLARFATSHYLYVLPYGRAKLLASAFATVALTAVFAACIVTMYYYPLPFGLELVFKRALAVSFVTASFLYVVLWLTGKGGNFGLLAGTLVLIATLVLPLRFISLPRTSLAIPWTICAVLWAVFAATFLLAPRLKASFGRVRRALTGFTGSSYRGGGEIDFLVGTARPWALAAGQGVPIAIATVLLHIFGLTAPSLPSPWLFFFTIMSVIAGAIAGLAATRSRALWLRARWTRAELFTHVESSFWRYNCCTLGVLLLLLVWSGDVLEMPTRVVAFGMGLLALASALSTYLGLIVTARIGWGDAVLAITAMLALMAAVVYTSSSVTPTGTLVALETGLALLTLIVRELARRRWGRLDWMLCRGDLAVRAST